MTEETRITTILSDFKREAISLEVALYNINDILATHERSIREESDRNFYAVMHRVREEAGKNQLKLLMKITNLYKAVCIRRNPKE